MSSRIRSALTDPGIMLSQDLMENPDLAPQLSDPDRIPHIEAFYKGTFPDRKPDMGRQGS